MKIFKEGKSKLFIVDAESDGLYGPIFAIAAIVVDIETLKIVEEMATYNGNFLDLRTGRMKDDWCKQNVIPAILEFNTGEFEVKYSMFEMSEYFWNFYIQYKDSSIVIADFGAPVEAKVFRDCIECPDIDPYLPLERNWDGPYPLHELGTMLMMKGMNPDIDRTPYYLSGQIKHNPLFDVYSTLELIKKEKLLY